MTSGMNERILFESYEFDPRTRQLWRNGLRVKLQPKPQAILACLLEHEGQSVAREELRTALWPEGTFVDFDLSINVAMRRLRDALNDSADTSKYIQTIPGQGYRFVAPIRRVSALPASERQPAADALPRIPAWRKIAVRAGVAVAAVVVVVLGGTAWTSRQSRPLHFQSRDWILIAAFDNRTGERLFDGSLEYALEREINPSNYVNIVPRARINDVLKLMRQPTTAVLKDELARQVALRDGGIRGVLVGRVEKFGTQYNITLGLVDPATGKTAVVLVREGKQEQLLEAVRSLAGELRSKLGEAALDLRPAGQSMERATTASLPALRVFSEGMKPLSEGNWLTSASLFEEAIREDPQFAAAHIYLAHCYANLGQETKAAPHFEAAFRLAPTVSTRERLFILGGYYDHFLHDPGRALASYEALVRLYPDDYWGVNNVHNLYLSFRMFGPAADMLERTRPLRPNDVNLLYNLWSAYRFWLFDEGKRVRYSGELHRLRNSGVSPMSSWADLDLEDAVRAWRQGDIRDAAQQIVKLNSYASSQSDRYKWTVSGFDLLVGKLRLATGMCGSIVEPYMRSSCLTGVALVGNNPVLAREQFPLQCCQSLYAGMAAARLGHLGLARKIVPVLKDSQTTLEGEILLDSGRPAEAVARLLTAFPDVQDDAMRRNSGPYLFSRHTLARAFEKQGNLAEAISTLEVVGPPQKGSWPLWNLLDCHLELVRLYRKAGRRDDAIRLRTELLHYLSEADGDHPYLIELHRMGD